LGSGVALVSLESILTVGASNSGAAITAVLAGRTWVPVHAIAAVESVLAVAAALALKALWPADAVLAILAGSTWGASVADWTATPCKPVLSVSAVFAGRSRAAVDACAAVPAICARLAWFSWQNCGDSVAAVFAGLATGAASANETVETGFAFGPCKATWASLARGANGAAPATEALRAHLALRSTCSWDTASSGLAGAADGAGTTVDAGSAGLAVAAVHTGASARAWSGFEGTDGCNFGEDVLLHQAYLCVQRLLVEGLALQERGLGHLELLLGHRLLVAESQNGSAVSGFGRHRP